MNLQMAIDILEHYLNHRQTHITNDLRDAINLGNEAIQAISKLRHYPFPDEILRLPGETDE